MKLFHEQKYPVSVVVKVRWDDDEIIDEVKGLNVGHALHRAKWNWETAKEITIIDEKTSKKGLTR